VSRGPGLRSHAEGREPEETFWALASASVVLLVLALARPALAGDFRLGIGGGATFVTGNYADTYKSGWNGTVRALWLPSSAPVGVRGAGSYGQDAPKSSDVSGTPIGNSALYGVDVNAAVRLVGQGADGLHVNLGIGFRSLRQKIQTPSVGTVTRTDSNISYNVGAGFSTSRLFVEAEAVYFKVQGTSLVSIPVTVGFQF